MNFFFKCPLNVGGALNRVRGESSEIFSLNGIAKLFPKMCSGLKISASGIKFVPFSKEFECIVGIGYWEVEICSGGIFSGHSQ